MSFSSKLLNHQRGCGNLWFLAHWQKYTWPGTCKWWTASEGERGQSGPLVLSIKIELTCWPTSWCLELGELVAGVKKYSTTILIKVCREPEWGIPPVTRSCRRKPDKTLGRVRLQGFPLETPEHPPAKIRICLLYYVMLSTYSSVVNRGLSPHHLFLEKS